MHKKIFAIVAVLFTLFTLIFLANRQTLTLSDLLIIIPAILVALVAIFIFVLKNREALNALTKEPSSSNLIVLKKLFFGKKHDQR